MVLPKGGDSITDNGVAEAKQGYIYGGIQSRGDMPFDILGDTMLKSIYAVSVPFLVPEPKLLAEICRD